MAHNPPELEERSLIGLARFETWAREIGLNADNPGEFEERYKTDKITYLVTMDIMGHICDLTTKHGDLERKYGLKSDRERPNSAHAFDPDDPVTIDGNFSIIWSKNAQTSWENSLLTFQQRVSRMQKLKWAVSDKAKFAGLVENLRYMNDGLRNILPPPSQRALDRHLIIDQPSNTANLDLLFQAKAISENYAAAARFKSMTIRQLGEAPSTPKASTLDSEHITPRGLEADRIIGEIAEKSEKTKVLIEYKVIEASDSALQTVLKERLQHLVSLLQTAPKPSSYRVLDCKGYFSDGAKGQARYGLVFTLPTALSIAPDPTFHTLHSLLRSSTDNKPPTAFLLGPRFRLATLLANSLSHLHAAGWLHRSLTSHNILCLSTGGARDLQYPYLAGFGYARLDDPREVSEVEARTADNLYRHPEYQLPAPRRKKYRRSYELYSLGVVLAEVGLWKQIDGFWRSTFDAATFAVHLRDNVVPLLGHYMGEGYRDAVACCLDARRFGVGDDEGRALLEAFSRKVVGVLEGCQV